jgi:hypothetical protein
VSWQGEWLRRTYPRGVPLRELELTRLPSRRTATTMDTDAQNGTDEGDQPTNGQSDGQLKRSHVEFVVDPPELGRALELLAVMMMELEPRRVTLSFYIERQEAP